MVKKRSQFPGGNIGMFIASKNRECGINLNININKGLLDERNDDSGGFMKGHLFHLAVLLPLLIVIGHVETPTILCFTGGMGVSPMYVVK